MEENVARTWSFVDFWERRLTSAGLENLDYYIKRGLLEGLRYEATGARHSANGFFSKPMRDSLTGIRLL